MKSSDNKISQVEQIKAHLLSGKKITSLEALYKFSCLRLGDRIYNLEKQGMKIDRNMIETNGKHVMQYFINFN